MNKIILLFALVVWGFSCSSQKTTPNKIQQAVDEFTADSSFVAAGIGILVKDVEKDEVLAHHNSKMALTPASSQKLITTATSLEILGSQYQFKTLVETDGKLKNGVLEGNLIIRGAGDPSLESKYFESRKNIAGKIVSELLELKIKVIQGDVLLDDSYFESSIPRTWIWEDIGNYYGAVPNAINYRDNMYTLHFASGKAGERTTIVKTVPKNTGLVFENEVVSSEINRDLAYIFGGNTSNYRRIEGSIPQNRKNFKVKGAFLNPKLALLEDLIAELKKNKIQILQKSNSSAEEKTQLFEMPSPALSEIVYWTNQKSVNLFADQLLFELGKNQNKEAGWKSGIKAIQDFWESNGIETQHQKLFDGSGLSHFNAISADFFSQILTFMYGSPEYETFLSSLAVAGKSGTLKYFGKGSRLESNWKAKTGSMTGVRSYCGYLTNSKGETYTVCILINNYNCSSKALNNKLLNLLINIYNS
ncbi:D-alanyl-D-alanine carboxypeptidase/D-alanyl-D-alanine endopeptidase [Marinifilum caeruleilacunae]|uniref:D-alanyl-D-alanine carboxypeptidase/D-alanyl-D-alanine-endopeptidase n=1 Tax=Marinifilum caeruleilacunae TaxID=2499076 RepID=A0ABX1WZ03_9BACT|nr:D-alanyl-D-alanine carboxypeptidase/D-alanyl-D-alanine-endopeptidase [Marinifilum caeruleilacunae]NOU61347.1 D-alanyl-D-alanine carboxypeptidase/D-alanyl-D-alanine-endopeptidase [Marinifilum caeruleilacunae]